MTTEDEALAFITNEIMPLPWHMSICINDRSIGYVQSTSDHEEHKAEIGYCLARKFWGRGIMTQALKKSVKMVLKDFPEIVRLEAIVDVENIGSQRVLEKAGFIKEGLLRKNTFNKGSFIDELIYSFLSTDVTEVIDHVLYFSKNQKQSRNFLACNKWARRNMTKS